MTLVDRERLERLDAGLVRRALDCPLPGVYLCEYLAYAFENDRRIASSMYFHEPEWLSSTDSDQQRRSVIDYLSVALGESFVREIFVPSGRLIRIDPSFRSQDDARILRLELSMGAELWRTGEFAERVLQYVRNNAAMTVGEVCGCSPDAVFHGAVEIDLKTKRPLAARLYFRNSREDGSAFCGVTFPAVCSDAISRRVYYNVQIPPDQVPPGPNDVDFVARYRVDSVNGKTAATKFYYFNEAWRKALT